MLYSTRNMSDGFSNRSPSLSMSPISTRVPAPMHFPRT